MDENRLFVGNVPFNCTADEFKKCFENIEGFVDSELIIDSDTGQSKGFGFVSFQNSFQAIKIMSTSCIVIANRRLRFSRYSPKIDDNKYKIFIGNIDADMTEEKLTSILSKFGKVLWCSINTKNKYITGTAVFKNSNGYYNAINNATMGNVKLGIRPYKDDKNYFIRKNDPAIPYREGFKAGYLTGFEQGFMSAFENAKSVGI